MSSIDSHPASATKTEPEIRAKSTEELRDEQMVLTGETSPGVARIEAINAHLTKFDRYFLGFGVFLIAYAYGLDGTVRYTYQVNMEIGFFASQAADFTPRAQRSLL